MAIPTLTIQTGPSYATTPYWAEVLDSEGEVIACFIGKYAREYAQIYLDHPEARGVRFAPSFACYYCGVSNEGADWVASDVDDGGKFCDYCRDFPESFPRGRLEPD